MIRTILILSSLYVASSFLTPSPMALSLHRTPSVASKTMLSVKDKSRSGTKRDRLNKLADLEESRVETDKGFVSLAAGGFVGLILLLLGVAFVSGVLDPVSTGY
jgi:hypothetical protein